MPELGGRELLHEWQKLMESILGSAATLAGRPDLPRQLLEQLQRQLELVQELVEHERHLQHELADQLLAPLDAVFDLLEESGAMLRRQAEALSASGRALEDAAVLMKSQADVFERTIGALRHPLELARSTAGLGRPRRRKAPAKPRARHG